MNMPAVITVDISVLVDFDTTLVVGDVEVPGNATVLNEPEDVIVRVAPPRLEVEIEDEEEELEEGEEGEEGEETEEEEEE